VSFIAEAENLDRDTMHAWECFVEHGHANKDIKKTVRSEILASWARCSNSGVSALSNATPQKFGKDDIFVLKRKNRSLCEAASLAFKRLAPHLIGTGAILILTDNTGTVIEATGDSQTLDAGREIQLEVGGVWNEQVIGTNGIGTALRTGMPTYVHASEHFCQGIKSWTCVGVPIIDALDRSVIGVVDLSGPSSIYRPHNVALVVATAREIELNLAQKQREEHTILLEKVIGNSKRRNTNNAIVLLNSSGKIVFSQNTGNLAMNGFGDFSAGTQFIDLFPDMSVAELIAALPPTLPTQDIDLIKANGKTQGVALVLGDQPKATLRPKHAGISLKELFARLIHSHATNKTTPYVVVDCATISPELIRRELFGQVADAFKGASPEDKLGKFEQANGGVLCLDEIGDMPPELQPYLLRTLEQRAVYRVGCDIRRPIDVQLIAMSSRNIRKDVESGRFRQDLFSRIDTIIIEIPPLRERGQDIGQLVDYFNNKLSNKYGGKALVIDASAMSALQQYQWPGNVRELRNTIERLCLLKQTEFISVSDLPDEIARPITNPCLSLNVESSPSTHPMDLEEVESIAVQRSIDAASGNLTKAAASLGISRPTLYRKIKLYGLNRYK